MGDPQPVVESEHCSSVFCFSLPLALCCIPQPVRVNFRIPRDAACESAQRVDETRPRRHLRDTLGTHARPQGVCAESVRRTGVTAQPS